LLQPSGAFYLKHDNRDFFHWSLEQLVAEKWHIAELSFDLHDSELSSDYKILTAYEKRWLGEGLTTNFVKALR
jgi:tRNA G46 methylase TrmB